MVEGIGTDSLSMEFGLPHWNRSLRDHCFSMFCCLLISDLILAGWVVVKITLIACWLVGIVAICRLVVVFVYGWLIDKHIVGMAQLTTSQYLCEEHTALDSRTWFEVREKGGRIVVVFNVANVRANSVQADSWGSPNGVACINLCTTNCGFGGKPRNVFLAFRQNGKYMI